MSTKTKAKKLAKRKERIRQSKAMRRVENARERKLMGADRRMFKDVKDFFDTIGADFGEIVYRKEQVKAGLQGEIRRIRILKEGDPEKYAKLSTKTYEDCIKRIDEGIQPKILELAKLVDNFSRADKDNCDSLSSATTASGLLNDIMMDLNETIDIAEGLYTDTRNKVLGIEEPETNPIAEEAKANGPEDENGKDEDSIDQTEGNDSSGEAEDDGAEGSSSVGEIAPVAEGNTSEDQEVDVTIDGDVLQAVLENKDTSGTTDVVVTAEEIAEKTEELATEEPTA